LASEKKAAELAATIGAITQQLDEQKQFLADAE